MVTTEGAHLGQGGFVDWDIFQQTSPRSSWRSGIQRVSTETALEHFLEVVVDFPADVCVVSDPVPALSRLRCFCTSHSSPFTYIRCVFCLLPTLSQGARGYM